MTNVLRLPVSAQPPAATVVPITCDGTAVLDDLDADGFRKFWRCPGCKFCSTVRPAAATTRSAA